MDWKDTVKKPHWKETITVKTPVKNPEPVKEEKPREKRLFQRAMWIDVKDGEDGKDGKNGKDGKDGVDGKSIVGPKGPKGEKGEPGLNGKDGKDGKNGKDGKDGIGHEWHLFVDRVDNSQGKEGDFSLVQETMTLYRKEIFNTELKWIKKGKIKGEDGQRGIYGGGFNRFPHKEKHQLTDAEIASGYFDLTVLAADSSTIITGKDTLPLNEDDDYTVSVPNVVTRITFAGSRVVGGDFELKSGDWLYVKCLK